MLGPCGYRCSIRANSPKSLLTEDLGNTYPYRCAASTRTLATMESHLILSLVSCNNSSGLRCPPAVTGHKFLSVFLLFFCLPPSQAAPRPPPPSFLSHVREISFVFLLLSLFHSPHRPASALLSFSCCPCDLKKSSPSNFSYIFFVHCSFHSHTAMLKI